MPAEQSQHKSPAVLILIDVINHFEFPDGKSVLRHALPIAPKLAHLKKRAQAARLPIIYVNDNFGQWRSDASNLVNYCVRPEAVGKQFVEQLQPDKNDYFVLKPMHSGFYHVIWALRRWYCAASLPIVVLFALRTTPRCASSTSGCPPIVPPRGRQRSTPEPLNTSER